MACQSASASGTVLFTGATGYVGALLAAQLLDRESCRVILAVREGHTPDSAMAPVRHELEALGRPLDDTLQRRVGTLTLPPSDQLHRLGARLKALGVTEIIHCAGCVDYFDTRQLEAVNVTFTARLLELAGACGVDRFIYLSTAYSSGYLDRCAGEALHGDPGRDPTEYTRTKREAEHLVAASGLPYQIIRPSIVIGDSRTGRYSGKRYGLYQQLMGLERLLCDRYHDEFHVVAPAQPINFVHQDALQEAFLHAYRRLPDNAIMHLTSEHRTAPSMRDLWSFWLESVSRPRRIYYYSRLEDVPLGTIHPRQRAYLMFASVNLEIASHYWWFDTGQLDRLRVSGLAFQDATLETVTLCQRRFIQSSSRVQRFIASHGQRMPTHCEIIDVGAHGGARQAASTP